MSATGRRPPDEMAPAPADRREFNQLVYAIVRRIPTGRLMTYGQIAALIPSPASLDPLAYSRIRARWVGYALATCPPDVPWQRVVNRDGAPSRRGSDGHLIQRELLLQEGVPLRTDGRFDLARAGWHPEKRDLAAIDHEGPGPTNGPDSP